MKKTYRIFSLLLAAAFMVLMGVGCFSASKDVVTSGGIGDTLSTYWFDFTVDEVSKVEHYYTYYPGVGNRLILVTVTEKSTFKEEIKMYDSDFILVWANGDEDYSWSVDPFTDEMMPTQFILGKKQSVTYKLLFEVPEDSTKFSLAYREVFDVENEDEKYGELFTVLFNA